MNTHILISMGKLQKRIEILKEAEKRAWISQEKAYLRGKLSMLEEISDLGKEISLNKEDIEEKANNYEKAATKPNSDLNILYGMNGGYRQALEDLI